MNADSKSYLVSNKDIKLFFLFFNVPMGEQHYHKAAAARCMQLQWTHGKHYVASGTLINVEPFFKSVFFFLIPIFALCWASGPVSGFRRCIGT